MPRYYKKKYYKGAGKDKYSVENTSVLLTTGQTSSGNLFQAAQALVNPTTTQGMRKVKHLTVSLTTQDTAPTVWWAVVYVPEGYAVNPISAISGASIYEPNQFVMSCGVNDPNAGPVRIRTPISRNLNSGDSIYLVVGTPNAGLNVQGVCTYAITLQ